MNALHNKIIENFKNTENPTILDVGCYRAEDSIIFSEILPQSQIYSFEADPRNIDYLKNIKLPENIKIIEGAISNYDGISDFYCSNDIDMGRDWKLSGSINKPTGHLTEYTVRFDAKPIEIFCQKLDTWYKNSDIYGAEIELIWCDTNGGEQQFLEGSIEVLKNTNLLYIECFEKELYQGQVNCEWVTNFLEKMGFQYIFEFGHNRLYERKI